MAAQHCPRGTNQVHDDEVDSLDHGWRQSFERQVTDKACEGGEYRLVLWRERTGAGHE
jgi:hypothetical protein